MTTEFILRLFAAALCGGLIGLERGYRAKEAGFRTHFLVALGSGLFMVISQFGFEDVLKLPYNIRLDPSRVAAQVVSASVSLAQAPSSSRSMWCEVSPQLLDCG